MENAIEANGKNSWHLKKGLRLLSKLVSAKASSLLVNSHLAVCMVCPQEGDLVCLLRWCDEMIASHL